MFFPFLNQHIFLFWWIMPFRHPNPTCQFGLLSLWNLTRLFVPIGWLCGFRQTLTKSDCFFCFRIAPSSLPIGNFGGNNRHLHRFVQVLKYQNIRLTLPNHRRLWNCPAIHRKRLSRARHNIWNTLVFGWNIFSTYLAKFYKCACSSFRVFLSLVFPFQEK